MVGWWKKKKYDVSTGATESRKGQRDVRNSSREPVGCHLKVMQWSADHIDLHTSVPFTKSKTSISSTKRSSKPKSDFRRNGDALESWKEGEENKEVIHYDQVSTDYSLSGDHKGETREDDSDMAAVPDPTQYAITHEYGFLYPQPQHQLAAQFSPWTHLTSNLCQLISEGTLRQAVQKLPVLDPAALTSESERLAAYSALCFLCNAYVWCGGPQNIPKVLPANIAVPLHRLSQHLGLKPLLTHVAFCLCNWSLVDSHKAFSEPGNVRSIWKFPEAREFNWFCVVTVLVEKAFSPAVKAIHECQRGVVSRDIPAVERSLHTITSVLQDMTQQLAKMPEHLTPAGFNNVIRPYLMGFGGDRSPLPEGLIYEGVSDVPVRLFGQSAAQSSTLQCLDAVLGVQHEPAQQSIIEALRAYMRPQHAQYIRAVERGPDVRMFVDSFSRSNPSLFSAYNSALCAVKEFRSFHVQIVARFIVVPASQAKTKGTGMMPWLKALRDDTESAKISSEDDEQGKEHT